jgi:GTPase SAR1 family protein
LKTIVVFVGPAGSGKSSLVAAYAKWLREADIPVATVNLDPAAEYVPYHPDVDVRNYVSAHEVAVKYGLGPNGALVKSMEIAAEKLGEILAPLAEQDVDYILVDTPGQMEVFIFRDISAQLVSVLKNLSSSVYGIFVVDATVVRNPADYVFTYIMALSVQLRLGIATAPVINKIDLARDLELRGDLVRDLGRIRKQLLHGHSLYTEMLRDVLRVLYRYARQVSVPKVSAVTGEGLDELHRIVHEMSCACGDLS